LCPSDSLIAAELLFRLVGACGNPTLINLSLPILTKTLSSDLNLANSESKLTTDLDRALAPIGLWKGESVEFEEEAISTAVKFGRNRYLSKSMSTLSEHGMSQSLLSLIYLSVFWVNPRPNNLRGSISIPRIDHGIRNS
jgi:hypothetical protein